MQHSPTRRQKAACDESSASRGPESRELAVVRTEDLDVQLARHHYSLGVVAGSLALVLHAGTPLRRVADVLAMSWSWASVDAATASYYSVRLWLLRLGLYQLNRPKEHADDWMWIVDHTVVLGPWKCLIISGIRQSAWDAEDRVLRHEDVELIDLVPVTESSGKIVYRQLKTAATKTGVPRAIVSDGGSDLRCGIDRFRKSHRQTAWVYDIKHKTATLLKHALECDVSWKAFVEHASRFKQQVSLTELAALAPPNQRSKSRYMNLDLLTDWAQRHLKLLDNRKAIRAAGLKPKRVEAKLGWLRKFAPQVHRWGEMLELAGGTEQYVRHQGIHATASEELAARLPKPTTPAAKRLRKDLLAFVQEQEQQVKGDERLLGSSEVLESLIGKLKRVAGEEGRHGLTGMVLSLGALMGKLTVETVQTALTEIRTRQVWSWCHTHLGPTVQSARAKIREALASEQKQQPLCPKNS